MLSDEQLIRKIKRRQSRDAADALLCRYYKEIYAYAYRQSGSRELAMDLTQDIFVAILQGISSFDERRAQFRTWVYHVAANKITDYYRSRAHKKLLAESSLLPESTCAPADARLPAEDSLLDLICSRETIRQIMEIVVQFDNDWVEIFRRKCLQEQTFSQIASQMRLPENTVKSRFYSMVRRIKKEVPYHDN